MSDNARVHIGEILKEKGLLNEEGLKKALKLQKKSNAKLGSVLLKSGLVSEDDLLYALADQYDIEFHEKLEVKDIQTLRSRIPPQFVQKYKIVPYHLDKNQVKVALMNPDDLHPLDELSMILVEFHIVPVIAPETEIFKIIHAYYEENLTDSEDLDEENDLSLLQDFDNLENSIDLANEAPIIKMVNMIISNAVSERASDIHIEPQEKEVSVRYRVDGMLHRVLSPPKPIQNGIISRIKIMANLNIAENRLPQDGRIKLRFSGKEIDIRVSTLPTQFGEKIVMRLLNKTDTKYELTKLGLEESTLKNYTSLIHNPNGIILIAGPTGSGKTSTLYASLIELNDVSRNIITVEDPVEYQMDGINQVQAKHKIGLTFAEGLRSILRQDPDVIMVGEIRDEETARIAIQASLTGHLVFSTIHTNDAPSSVTRLLDMGIENYLITSSCLGFMSQRLIRVLCPKCKKKKTVLSSFLKKQGYKPMGKNKKMPTKITIYEANGCKECMNIGYKGRAGVYELLVLDNELKDMVLKNPSLDDFTNKAIEKGMITIRESALNKVVEGITTLEEINRIS